MTPHNDYRDRIEQDPEIMVGKPVVKGTRIPVSAVLQHLADNSDTTELLAAFPELTDEDIKACLAYARAVLDEQHHPTPTAQQTAPQKESASAALLRLAKIGGKGPSDASRRIDDYLYGATD